MAAVVCALLAPAAAQPKKPPAPKPPPAPPAETTKDAKPADKKKDGGKDKVKTFDFTGLDLSGRLRTPQLLYFLERANEELERASLKKKSFVPHMVRSVEDEKL